MDKKNRVKTYFEKKKKINKRVKIILVKCQVVFSRITEAYLTVVLYQYNINVCIVLKKKDIKSKNLLTSIPFKFCIIVKKKKKCKR